MLASSGKDAQDATKTMCSVVVHFIGETHNHILGGVQGQAQMELCGIIE